MPSNSPKKSDKETTGTGKSGRWVKPPPEPKTPSVPDAVPPDAPTEKFPIYAPVLDSKKWLLKDALVFHPNIEKWYFINKDTVQMPVEERSSYLLKRNTIVDILPQDVSIPWSAIAYEVTLYDYDVKSWVTTRLTGWVNNENLDDYLEEFPDSEVVILHKTKNSTDLEQDMTIEDEGFNEIHARYNMCGELCIAFIVKNDIDTKVSIDDVLNKWRESGVKNKEGVNVNYARLVGKGSDKGLESKHLKEILDLYNTVDVNKEIEPYAIEGKKIPLGMSVSDIPPSDPYDDRHASTVFREKLLKFYFIALVTINPNTGELIPNPEPTKRNHWVVVDKISHDGVRVEIYNPSPNKRQTYSFREFSASVGSNPNAGWWVERKQHRTKDADKVPAPEVTIENPTPIETDAEQYILVDRLKKVNLCGEFSVAYILKNSLDQALQQWSNDQVALKMHAKESAGIWELATVLQAFGMNSSKMGTQSYSIDNILKYWKLIQPDLYGSILGGSNNETTGQPDLITILKAYGYNNKDDYKLGGLASSPGASAEMLKRYYFIAGVKIDTTKKGRLKNKLGDGVDHWVVLTEIMPNGSLVGGNGGWVKLYNPFMNVLEEYSYKEFMESFSGAGLWVTRDVHPVFTWQPHVPAKDKNKKSNAKSKAVVNKIPEANLRREIQKKIDSGTTSLNSIADMLSNPKLGFGWSRSEILKLLKNPEVKSTGKSLAEVEELLCKSLEIDFIPREIAIWVRKVSGNDSSFAVALVNLLKAFGILVIEDRNGKEIKPEDPPLSTRDKRGRIVHGLKDGSFPHTLQTMLADRFNDSVPSSQLARNIVNAFTDRVIAELREIPPIEVAYKSWADYIKWEGTIALPESNIYRVRHWGDVVFHRLGLDTEIVHTSNFQAVGLYNRVTGFGAISNYVHILRDDIDHLIDMQFDQIVDGKKMRVEDKMNWLCQYEGRIYFFDNRKDSWQSSERIRWGTLALGGNLVQVVDEDWITLRYPGEKPGEKPVKRRMMKLKGFRKSDWSRPIDELLAEGLVHRCFVANSGNSFADTSRGIVYSPFYDVTQWTFNNGTAHPDGLWIPWHYLEPRPDPKLDGKPEPTPEFITELDNH